MKNIFILIFLLIFFVKFYSQYNIYYDLVKKVENNKLTADGLLIIDNKENKSDFYLSQYQNLLNESNYSVKDIKIIHNNSICQDNKEYFFNFEKKIRKLFLYDVTCDSKTLITEKITFPQWKYRFKNKKI